MTVNFQEYVPKQGDLFHITAITSGAAKTIAIGKNKVVAITAEEKIGYILDDGTDADPMTNGIPLERWTERIRNMGANTNVTVRAQATTCDVTIEVLEDTE